MAAGHQQQVAQGADRTVACGSVGHEMGDGQNFNVRMPGGSGKGRTAQHGRIGPVVAHRGGL